MYTSTYNTEATSKKITEFNRAQMVAGWFADAYQHEFTRTEKKHLAWSLPPFFSLPLLTPMADASHPLLI